MTARALMPCLALLVACPGPDGTTSPDTLDDTAGATDDTQLAESVLVDAQQGDPGLLSVQQIAFGPDGVLVIGDGIGDRIVAIETGDTDADERAANAFATLPDLSASLSAAMGGAASPGDVWVNDLDVNPITGRVYLAAERGSTGETAVLTVNGAGEVFALDLSDVSWAAVGYPQEGGPGSIIADLAWGDGGVVASAQEGTWTESQVIVISLPFTHGADAAVSSTRSFHTTHDQWETTAPVDRFFAYTHDGTPYIAAGYSCAPVVRFAVDELAAGEPEVSGETPFDFGGGKQLTDFAHYSADGVDYLIAAVHNLDTSVSNRISAASIEMDLLTQSERLNDEAPIVFNMQGSSIHPQVRRLTELDNVDRVARLDDEALIVVRQDALETLAVP